MTFDVATKPLKSRYLRQYCFEPLNDCGKIEAVQKDGFYL